MFGKDRRTTNAGGSASAAAAAAAERHDSGVDTIVLEGTRVEGDLRVPGGLRIEGRLQGSLDVAGAIWVGPTAEVTADVRAQSAAIAGVVRGDVRVRGAVELLPGSRLEGDVYAMSFRIEDGAAFLGKCYMGEAYVLRETRR